jgi:hypothetical protein
MAIVKVCKDDALLKGERNLARVRLRKDVRLLREIGHGCFEDM